MYRDLCRGCIWVVAIVAGTFLPFAACAPTVGDERPADSNAVRAVGPMASTVAAEPSVVAVAADKGQPRADSIRRRLPDAPARDADQDFLHHMLDHHEAVVIAVHAQMMDPVGHASHGTRMDPSEWDGRLDAEKREMLSLLRKHYGEDYSPRASGPAQPADSASPGAMGSMPMSGGPPSEKAEAEHMAGQARIVSQLRDGAALTDRFASRLRRTEVRDLARRVQVSQLELARKLAAGMQIP